VPTLLRFVFDGGYSADRPKNLFVRVWIELRLSSLCSYLPLEGQIGLTVILRDGKL